MICRRQSLETTRVHLRNSMYYVCITTDILTSMSAPASTSRRTASRWPFSEARCNDVKPSGSERPTLAPCARSILRICKTIKATRARSIYFVKDVPNSGRVTKLRARHERRPAAGILLVDVAIVHVAHPAAVRSTRVVINDYAGLAETSTDNAKSGFTNGLNI